MAIFNKKKDNKNEPIITTGRVSDIPYSEKTINIDRWKTTDLLRELTQTNDKYDAIDLIIEKTPDGKMAYNTYLRIANQGFTIELNNAQTGKPIKKYDRELRTFCANMSKNNASGLDGFLDMLHGSAISHGGMAVEVVVSKDLSMIDDVVLIDPKTITEFKWLPEKSRYGAYQSQMFGNEKKDLYDGNFFWIAHQPKNGRPDGTLQFEPAIVTMTQVYQLLKDSMVVLNRIGFPKYDISISLEKLLASATPQQLADADSRKKLIQNTFNEIANGMKSISRDSNLVHFDNTTVSTIGGGVNGSGIDVRAWFEILEPLIVNAFQLTPVLMGRLKSGSYSLGTVEFQIVTKTVDSMRRASKRMIENIVNIWARVNGYNVQATVTHNPIDWQAELDMLEVNLKRMEQARRAEEYKYVSHETASIMALKSNDDIQPEQANLYEYIKKNLASPTSENTDSAETESEDNPNEQKNNQ